MQIAYVYEKVNAPGILPAYVLDSYPVVLRSDKHILLLYRNINRYDWEETRDHYRVFLLPFEQVKKIVEYQPHHQQWHTIYEDSECAGRYIVEIEKVKKENNDDSADETIEQSGTVQEEK